jgi:peptidoglycan hydrolase CwlO-like protein
MRRVIATISAFALVGALTVDIAARTPATSRETIGTGQPAPAVDTPQRTDPQACAELGQLRQELARLQQELRHLQAALAEARKAGNRERAEQIMQAIRRVQAEIENVQQKIRRLQKICR